MKHSNNQKARKILGENHAIDRCRFDDMVADGELSGLYFLYPRFDALTNGAGWIVSGH
jgi:hypothetical protein